MNRKYIVWNYFIIVLEVITQMWGSDDFYFVSFYFPTYLPWAHCYLMITENINAYFKRRT